MMESGGRLRNRHPEYLEHIRNAGREREAEQNDGDWWTQTQRALKKWKSNRLYGTSSGQSESNGFPSVVSLQSQNTNGITKNGTHHAKETECQAKDTECHNTPQKGNFDANQDSPAANKDTRKSENDQKEMMQGEEIYQTFPQLAIATEYRQKYLGKKGSPSLLAP